MLRGNMDKRHISKMCPFVPSGNYLLPVAEVELVQPDGIGGLHVVAVLLVVDGDPIPVGAGG